VLPLVINDIVRWLGSWRVRMIKQKRNFVVFVNFVV
jgi:hypothetical protein